MIQVIAGVLGVIVIVLQALWKNRQRAKVSQVRLSSLTAMRIRAYYPWAGEHACCRQLRAAMCWPAFRRVRWVRHRCQARKPDLLIRLSPKVRLMRPAGAPRRGARY